MSLILFTGYLGVLIPIESLHYGIGHLNCYLVKKPIRQPLIYGVVGEIAVIAISLPTVYNYLKLVKLNSFAKERILSCKMLKIKKCLQLYFGGVVYKEATFPS